MLLKPVAKRLKRKRMRWYNRVESPLEPRGRPFNQCRHEVWARLWWPVTRHIHQASLVELRIIREKGAQVT